MPSEPEDGGSKHPCPECHGTLYWKKEEGKVVCSECGVVVDDKIMDRGPEWRSYNQEEREERRRVGPPINRTIQDKGLSTRIGRGNRDARGKNLPPERRFKYHRMRKWNRRSKTAGGRERNVRNALSDIKRAGSILGIPHSIQERASELYRKASNADLIRGRPSEYMVAATLYIACCWADLSRSLSEICDVLGTEIKGAKKSHRMIVQELDVQHSPIEPGARIPEVCDALQLPDSVRKAAYDLAEKVKEMDRLPVHSSRVLSVAIVYLASIREGAGRTQEHAAAMAEVSRTALSSAVSDLRTLLEDLEGPGKREDE